MSMDRPNFVLFITDQQRADFLGCAGHPVLRTPNIDSIAASGVRFDRCYVASPICMPNRASLLTGRMPTAHQARSNGIPLSRRATTLGNLLHEAGYATGLVGKSHLQNHLDAQPLCDRPAIKDGYHEPSAKFSDAFQHDLADDFYTQETPRYWKDAHARVQVPYYGFDHVELTLRHGDIAEGDYLHWAREKGVDLPQIRGKQHQLAHDYICPDAWRTAVPEEVYPTAFVADRSVSFLRQAARSDRPFFLLVSFPDPHHPFTPPGRYWDMYSPDSMPLPAAYSWDDWDPPPHVRQLLDEHDQGRSERKFIGYAINEREAREAQALTCGLISCIDDAVGRVLESLKALGLDQKTVVSFTTDHGDYLGDHRLLLKGPAHYQSLIRTPFIWSDPMLERQGETTDALASTIDITATILDRARIGAFVGMQGKSLLPVLEENAAPRDAVLIQEEQQRLCYGFTSPPHVQTLVTKRWRMSLYRGADWGELYDLENDPDEKVNLWSDPAHAHAKAGLLERFLKEELDLVDTSPFPTGQA
jgi:arylsulfatase A-like enzyme